MEFLAERPVALKRLHDALAGDGIDPDGLLDGSVASLVALWVWLRARLSGKDDAQSQRLGVLPTWSRYTFREESTLSEAAISAAGLSGVTARGSGLA